MAARRITKMSTILYAPWRFGQKRLGVDTGSAKIMQYVNQLTHKHNLIGIKSSIITPQAHHANNNEEYHFSLYKKRIENINEHVLTIGGDHSVAVGSIMGSLYSVYMNDNKHIKKKHRHDLYKFAVIWIDAHADINTLESSDSGNVHGMPLAFVTGIDKSWDWLNAINLKLEFSDLYYWGIRDLDNFEIDVIDKYGIKVCSDKDEVMDVIDKYEYVHTSFDIDGLDPKYAPSTGTRADHGLELIDVIDYLNYVRLSGKSTGIDLVEYNPEIGTEQEKKITEQTVKSLLRTLL